MSNESILILWEDRFQFAGAKWENYYYIKHMATKMLVSKSETLTILKNHEIRIAFCQHWGFPRRIDFEIIAEFGNYLLNENWIN